METVSVNRFRERLREYVEKVASNHEPLRVTRRNGEDFVVVSADDWDQHEETLYVLKNSDLMSQITRSMGTHLNQKGYVPNEKELDEIHSI